MKHEREIKDFELSVNILAEIFLNKQFGEEDEPKITIDNKDVYWVADDVGGILYYGDWSFGFNDILTDLKDDAPKGAILKYNDYVVQVCDENVAMLNYHSWLKGAPRPRKVDLQRLNDMKRRFAKAISDYEDKINGTDF